MPVQAANLRAGGGVPNDAGPVLPRRCDPLPVGAERRAPDEALAVANCAQLLTGGCVEDLYDLVARQREAEPVGTELGQGHPMFGAKAHLGPIDRAAKFAD